MSRDDPHHYNGRYTEPMHTRPDDGYESSVGNGYHWINQRQNTARRELELDRIRRMIKAAS